MDQGTDSRAVQIPDGSKIKQDLGSMLLLENGLEFRRVFIQAFPVKTHG